MKTEIMFKLDDRDVEISAYVDLDVDEINAILILDQETGEEIEFDSLDASTRSDIKEALFDKSAEENDDKEPNPLADLDDEDSENGVD